MAENNNQLQIELKPEVADGIYSNLAILTHSSSEFVADFVQMMYAEGTGEEPYHHGTRTCQAPAHGLARQCAEI